MLRGALMAECAAVAVDAESSGMRRMAKWVEDTLAVVIKHRAAPSASIFTSGLTDWLGFRLRDFSRKLSSVLSGFVLESVFIPKFLSFSCLYDNICRN